MKIDRNQFQSENSAHCKIAELNPFNINTNEGVHTFQDHAMVHIVFWEPLTLEQETVFLGLVREEYPSQIISIKTLGDGEYKFYLKYAELL
jgi:hypothetical protein